jgi:hypothetical protein
MYGYWLQLGGGIVQSVPCNCDNLFIHWVPRLSSNHLRFIHQISLLLFQQKYLVVKREKLGEKCRGILLELSPFIPLGSLTCRKSRHGIDGFTSPPKNVVLWISIALKYPLYSTGFEPANFGFSGKTHYTNLRHVRILLCSSRHLVQVIIRLKLILNF